ncbi:MAG: PQQ-dependent sugar dehydrogenase [Paracoccus sp. (in: a-proteobacteria)]|uniref:PQQ-dependent sugar dehydrogenase n=1 Tax=Paracoccus sp. TaxID=267 RepID=UPI0039E63E9B
MKPFPTIALLAATLTATPALAQLNQAPPNAPGQQPAFQGQTRAPELADGVRVRAQEVVTGLDGPWGLDLLPDGGWLITERPGRMRLFRDGKLSQPISGLPPVDARGQGGLLDVLTGPDFGQTRRVWWSYAEPRGEGRNATAVATGILSPDGAEMRDVKVIFRQDPAWASDKHFGSRLVLDGKGGLFITTGERSDRGARPLAQDVNTHLGKVLHVDAATGAPLAGNPFAEGGGKPEVFSWGHRNIQSAALDGRGRLWTVEHGARGGDELNLIRPGRNYGWPVAAYGIEYGGGKIGQGQTRHQGTEQPVYYWDPVIAPSGMALYEGAMFPQMRGDFLIGGLKARALVRLRIQGERVTEEQHLAQGIGRVRDVAIAPDGAIMLLTDEGKLVRLAR